MIPVLRFEYWCSQFRKLIASPQWFHPFIVKICSGLLILWMKPI